MKRTIIAVFLLISFCTSSSFAEWKTIANPSTFANDVVSFYNRGDTKIPAKQIVTTMGIPSQQSAIEKSFAIIDGKQADFSKLVYDKNYNDALRQIMHYSYIKEVGFMYYRFNFKMTKWGWVLTSFDFKGEDKELFPPGFAITE